MLSNCCRNPVSENLRISTQTSSGFCELTVEVSLETNFTFLHESESH